MRKALFLAVVISLVTVISAQAAEIKIGIFNSRAVAANSEPFTAARKKIENQYMPEKKKLDAQAQGLQKQADDLQKQRSALSREALTEKSDAFMRAKRNFEDATQAYSRKVEAALIRIDQEFGARMFQAAQDYGMRAGLSVLIDTAAGGIIYNDKSVDVTDELIKEVARVYREGKPIPGQQQPK
ncbi:Outer membrane family protein [uncultured delta proteobacterium]|uniref:Outer membrane family protein n=1 Tax=uncultured delta proteobacterium TaxID=34034 RepID=A0A212JVZ0_9DELT|nr:Outer membrane family protein [uncultured delta proteobacterium]